MINCDETEPSSCASEKKWVAFARGWNCLRIWNKAALLQHGNDMIMGMCSACLTDRASACTECADLHDELDALEPQIVPDLFPYKSGADGEYIAETGPFDRCVDKRDKLVADRKAFDSVPRCSCGHQLNDNLVEK